MASMFWGVLGIFLTRILHVPIENFVLGLPGPGKVFLVVFITAVLAGDFALSFRDALELREVLTEMEKMEDILREMEAEQGGTDKILKIEKFLDKLASIRNGIQAQLSARYEVKISNKVR